VVGAASANLFVSRLLRKVSSYDEVAKVRLMREFCVISNVDEGTKLWERANVDKAKSGTRRSTGGADFG
jgi:hypothetical protein